jgi:hypothetical protein
MLSIFLYTFVAPATCCSADARRCNVARSSPPPPCPLTRLSRLLLCHSAFRPLTPLCPAPAIPESPLVCARTDSSLAPPPAFSQDRKREGSSPALRRGSEPDSPMLVGASWSRSVALQMKVLQAKLRAFVAPVRHDARAACAVSVRQARPPPLSPPPSLPCSSPGSFDVAPPPLSPPPSLPCSSPGSFDVAPLPAPSEAEFGDTFDRELVLGLLLSLLPSPGTQRAVSSHAAWGFDGDGPLDGDERYAALFLNEPQDWNRLGDFQDVTLRLIAERAAVRVPLPPSSPHQPARPSSDPPPWPCRCRARRATARRMT